MPKDNIKRICLWSGPRNISTTMMYSFAQRSDTRVYDEPLYAFYLSHSKAGDYHPGVKEVLASMESDGDKVVKMMMGDHDKPVVFFKNITHHLLDLDRSFMKDVFNIILTRDPVEVIPSFAKVVENPTMIDVGFEMQMKLVNDLQKMNVQPIVLDAKKVLLNPRRILEQVCNLIDIPFDEKMLHWKAGARPEDGIWAKYWYDNVHKSTGFNRRLPKTDPFPERLIPLLNACKPYYDQLMKLALD